jgi:hypothetical protein
MPTYIYSKEDFIKWIDKTVSDNQVIVFTNDLTGNLSVSEKSGLKITHQYSKAVFTDAGVGHIAFNKSSPFGLIISDKARLSEKAKSVLNEKQ